MSQGSSELQRIRFLCYEECMDLKHPNPDPGFWIESAVARLSVVMMSMILFMVEPAFSADIPCRLKANSESVEVQIVVGGKEYWHGTIQKDGTQHVSIPEGAFTLVSKMYNPNLRTYEDVRTETHTRVCLERPALSVPLFADH
ncbi:MAG: hypothetical protein OJF51_000674 [Nitrospira sp.]|nr:MAG: hypothetical protein OJF51_000674 [Nitrospira sp.]